MTGEDKASFWSMRFDKTYVLGLAVAFLVWNSNQSAEVRSLREAVGQRENYLAQRNRELDSMERRVAALERGCK